jgi:hypothetical protein
MTTDPKKTTRHPTASLVQSTREALDLPVPATTLETDIAKFALDSTLCGVSIVRAFDGRFGEQHIPSLMLELDAQLKLLRAGDMSAVEAMLFSQATALQAIFVDLATRAKRQERLPVMQAQLTLALKAQAQCRATLEALAEVKNPRHPNYVKQQNIAQQQVVNNSPSFACGAAEIENSANKLVTMEPSDATLDSRGTGAASGADSDLEAVVAVHRAVNDGGKATGK